jgi:hypothetical protein
MNDQRNGDKMDKIVALFDRIEEERRGKTLKNLFSEFELMV